MSRSQTSFNGRELTLNPLGEGGKQFPKEGALGRKDEQLYLEIADSALAMEINQVVGGCFEIYAKKYKGILDSCDPVSSWTCKIQKTKSGGGYHIWHSENGSFLYRDRVVTWMIYLNDIPMRMVVQLTSSIKISFQPKRHCSIVASSIHTCT